MNEEKTIDMKQGTDGAFVPWQIFVQEVTARIRQRALRLMVLGFIVYGGGTLGVLLFVDPKYSLTLVMFMFQLMVIYMAVWEIFPCIRGAFMVTLESTNRSVPVFERMGRTAERVSKYAERYEDRDVVEEIKAEFRAGVVRIEAKFEEARPKALDWTPPDLGEDPLLEGNGREKKGKDPEVDPKAETRVFRDRDRLRDAVRADVCSGGSGHVPGESIRASEEDTR